MLMFFNTAEIILDFKYRHSGLKASPEHAAMDISTPITLGESGKEQQYRVANGYYVVYYTPEGEKGDSKYFAEQLFMTEGAARRFFRIMDHYTPQSVSLIKYSSTPENEAEERIEALKEKKRTGLPKAFDTEDALELLAFMVVKLKRASIASMHQEAKDSKVTETFLELSSMKEEGFIRPRQSCFMTSYDLNRLLWEAITEIPKGAAGNLEFGFYENRALKIGRAMEQIDRIEGALLDMSDIGKSGHNEEARDFLTKLDQLEGVNLPNMITRQQMFTKKISSIRGRGPDGSRDWEFYRVFHIEAEQRETYLSTLDQLPELIPEHAQRAEAFARLVKDGILLMRENADVRNRLRTTTDKLIENVSKFRTEEKLHEPEALFRDQQDQLVFT